MKKFLILTLALFTLSITCAFAATTVEFTIDSTEYSVLKTEAQTHTLFAAPYIKNSRTMAPVRAISEAFDATVSWDDNTKTVYISKDKTNISLSIGSNKIIVDGETKTISCAAEIVNGTTFIPLRAVTEVLGYYVYYADSTRQILIDDVAPVFSVNGIDVPYNVYRAFYTFNTDLDENTGLPVRDESTSAAIYDELSLIYTLFSEANKTFPGFSAEEKEELLVESKDLIASDERGKFSLSGSIALYFEAYMPAYKYNNILADRFEENTSDSDVLNFYRENYICAKHVLIMANASRTEKEALDLANKVYNQAISGKNFDELVSDYGEDPGVQYWPDGYVFTEGEMVEEFEYAAYNLPVGSVSKPVKTAYGYHIILRCPLPEDPAILNSAKAIFVASEHEKHIEELQAKADIFIKHTPVEALYL